MTGGETSSKLFLSCVSDEFGKRDAPYGDARQKLAHYLRRANCGVKSEEDFSQNEAGTLEMLDDYIRGCGAVVHLVGEMPGSVPKKIMVDRLLKKLESEKALFLDRQPDPLRDELGDLSGLTYTQWEAFLALHHGIPLFVYRTEKGRETQEQHFQRLELADPPRFGNPFTSREDLFGQMIGDLQKILTNLPELKPMNLPGTIGGLFKGRESMLETIVRTLETAPGAITQAQAISGLGGIGKSRLAIEFGHRHAEEYSALFFLSADSPEALRRNLAELAGPLVLDFPGYEHDLETRLAAAVRWLETREGWFLILDNVDSEEAAAAVEELLPSLSRGDVLITSRLSKWSGLVKKLDLRVLDDSAAREFLLARTAGSRPETATDDADLDALLGELDGLALALEQAGAYVAEREISFAEYLRRFAEQKGKVLEWHDERAMQHPASVATTWQTSFEQLDGDARDLLNQLSFLAPEPVPRALVPEMEEDALIALRRLSLVRFLDDPPDCFVVHRLVQEIVRSRLGNDAASVWEKLIGKLVAWAPSAGQEFSTWERWEEFQPHAENIFHPELKFTDSKEICFLLNGFAGFEMYQNGTYLRAEPLLVRALEVRERVLDSEHPDTLMSLNNLAELLDSKGNYQEAEPLYRRVMEVRERVLGSEHLDTLITLNNLAGLLLAKGKYQAAEPLFRRALRVRERVLGSEHPDTLSSVNNVAALLKAKGDYREAEPLYRRALMVSEQVLGSEHPDTLNGLNNLAALLDSKGDYREAEPLLRRALEVRERVLGGEHPDTLRSLNNLAAVLYSKGDYREAEPLLRRALEVIERVLGSEHPNTLTSINNLAELLQAKGDYWEAEPLYRRALKGRERVLGSEHPNTLTSINNLAALLQAKGDCQEAEPLYRRAVAGLEAKLGPDHPNTKIVRANWQGCVAAMKGETDS